MPKVKGPGPKYQLPTTIGLNDHDPTREKAPGFSMGSRRPYKYTVTPGPYMVEGNLSNKGWRTNGGFSIKGRPKQDIWGTGSKDTTPGPSFSQDQHKTANVLASSPRYSFGATRKTEYKNAVPGPNSYNLPSCFGQGPRTTMGPRTGNSFSHDYAKTPGPKYNYNYSNTVSNAPAFSMGIRFKRQRNKMDDNPGPIYNPPHNGTVKASPRFSMGVYHHEDVVPMPDVG